MHTARNSSFTDKMSLKVTQDFERTTMRRIPATVSLPRLPHIPPLPLLPPLEDCTTSDQHKGLKPTIMIQEPTADEKMGRAASRASLKSPKSGRSSARSAKSVKSGKSASPKSKSKVRRTVGMCFGFIYISRP